MKLKSKTIDDMSEEEKGNRDYSFFVGLIIGSLIIGVARQSGVLIGALPTIAVMAICGFITKGIWSSIKS